MTPDFLESLRRDRAGSHTDALTTSKDNDSDSDSDDGVRANAAQAPPAIPRTPSQSIPRTPSISAPSAQRVPVAASQLVAPVPPMLPAQGDEVQSASFSQRPMSMITPADSVARSPSIRSVSREAEDSTARTRGAGSLAGRPDPVGTVVFYDLFDLTSSYPRIRSSTRRRRFSDSLSRSWGAPECERSLEPTRRRSSRLLRRLQRPSSG